MEWSEEQQVALSHIVENAFYQGHYDVADIYTLLWEQLAKAGVHKRLVDCTEEYSA